MKTGGGSPNTGEVGGIHWHMNVANEITYLPIDEKRQDIPWVRLKDRNGNVTEYLARGSQLTPEQIEQGNKRKMDCIDCHNRPTHIYLSPNEAVDKSLAAGRLDATLPYLKAKGVEALAQPYQTNEEAVAAIETRIHDYYRTAYPDLYATKTASITSAVAELQQIYQTYFFPEMKTDWKAHINNIGHYNATGCFRCHVALLTIFFGGFLTAQFGSTGQLPLAPGQSSDLVSETVVDLENVNQITKKLPFEVTFTDIQQRLLKKEGPITASNTLDWITRFTIKDETGIHEGSVQMNRPFDYRGYRFFQASFIPVGRARNITVRLTPSEGGTPQDVTIDRGGVATLENGTKVRFSEFRGNFRVGPEDPNEDTSSYPNPAAVLQVTNPGSTPQVAYAFGPQMANIPVAGKPVAGYTYQLLDFEKVSDQHVLSAQRDPGATVVYVGFAMLFVTLVGVFFFSHQRVWAVVEEGPDNTSQVVIGGNTNRNRNGFVDKFNRLAAAVQRNLG